LPLRQYGSVVFGSFNIRKLGKVKTGSSGERDQATFEFLASVCRHFDLLAIQEVMSDTESLLKLLDLMGPDYGVVHSDTTGAFPGRRGNAERLAYVYNRRLVRRSALVTDVTFDRTEVIKRIADHNDGIHEALADLAAERASYHARLAAFLKQGGERPREPAMGGLKLPGFLTFARTPFAAGFQVHGHPGSVPYEFLAVNVHLFFGDSEKDRRWEAEALLDWMLAKVRSGAAQNLNIVLFGDLNLVFDDPERDRERINRVVLQAAKRVGLKEAQCVLPFLFPHPSPQQLHEPAGTVFRTNARLSQTYDQLGAFYNDPRLDVAATHADGHKHPDAWGTVDGLDYGVFNFTELFSQALEQKRYHQLTEGQQDRLVERYEYRISDHLPIWVRLPLPVAPPLL
ncbi:MAG: endonuclease/exonuclease/phosphatase family protein, partial [Acidobacteriota bacterium]